MKPIKRNRVRDLERELVSEKKKVRDLSMQLGERDKRIDLAERKIHRLIESANVKTHLVERVVGALGVCMRSNAELMQHHIDTSEWVFEAKDNNIK
jgi:uncharacterized coiled-coil protein SlyX